MDPRISDFQLEGILNSVLCAVTLKLYHGRIVNKWF